MEITNLLRIQTIQELRHWFELHGHSEQVCWVIVSTKSMPNGLDYLDVVEVAICFGWIDSTKKKMPDGQLVQRLSPRRKGSNWTELNKERVRRLESLGLMTDAGRQTLPDMSPASFKVDEYILIRIQEDEPTYKNYLNFPELYRRIRIDTIQSVRKDEELFHKRLNKFIDATKHNKQYGQWNDNSRLLDY